MLRTFIAILLFSFGLSSELLARQKVIVGLAQFPPFIVNEGPTVGGLAAEMLALMNAQQSRYEFVAIPTLPNTRHKTFALGRYDMSMFESLDWGWEGYDVDASDVYLTGGEIYITQAQPGRDQRYFDKLEEKKLIGIEGYHYGFAGFNSDPAYLTQHFNIELTRSNLGSIQMVLAGNRGDIAVVTQSYLGKYLNENPEARSKLLLSEKLDQAYRHRIILRRGISPSIEEINALLSDLGNSGKLEALWTKIKLN